jgi:hypothetical protein
VRTCHTFLAMKHLYTARDTMEAHFVKGLLESHDIEAVVHGEMLAGARGELPLTNDTLPSIWVRDEDLKAAHDALRRYREGLPPDGSGAPWQCLRCNETLEPQFSHCWRCGAGRGDPADPVPVQPIEGPLPLDYESGLPEDPDAPWLQPPEPWDIDADDDADERQ